MTKKLTLRQRLANAERERNIYKEQLASAARALSVVLARDTRYPLFSRVQRRELQAIFKSLHVRSLFEIVDSSLKSFYAPEIAKILNSPSVLYGGSYIQRIPGKGLGVQPR